jgi:hypothetical protein
VLAVGVRRRLVIDRRSGVATLSQKGLFRLPDRTIPFGCLDLALIPKGGDDPHYELKVTAHGLARRDRRGLVWYAYALPYEVKSEQAEALRPWVGIVPPLPPRVAELA